MEKLNVVMDHCPSCFETLKSSATSCDSCGIVIENYKRVSVEKRLKLTISGLYHLTSLECVELEKAWQKVEILYHDNDLHNQFIHHCLRLKSLPYAIKKYSDRLELNPFDEIAMVMKNRIFLLASELLPGSLQKMETSVFPSVLLKGLLRTLVVILVMGVCGGAVLTLISALTQEKFFFFGLGLFISISCYLAYRLLTSQENKISF